MLSGRNSILGIAALAILAIGLAACGGDDNSDTSAPTQASSSGGETVMTESISGVGNALVDQTGMVLYTNDMETGSKVVCTDDCLTEWIPLAAPAGGKATANDSAVQEKLGMIKRPDGSRQVTFGGQPLYTFVDDSPGQSTGNGFTDSFGGTTFVWTAATASGGTGESPTTTTEPSPGGGVGY
jgi:predicted lipoprotein with Yx(FWY)xxD motif